MYCAGTYLEMAVVLGITTFDWNCDRKKFFEAWNAKCRVSCMDAAMLVYDHNKPANLILQLGKDQAKTLLSVCEKQANKRKAEQAGIEAEPIQPPPTLRTAPTTPTMANTSPTMPSTTMVG